MESLDLIFKHYNTTWSSMGIITIDDLWNTLLIRGDIKLDELIRVKQLTHKEQQKELEKYNY